MKAARLVPMWASSKVDCWVVMWVGMMVSCLAVVRADEMVGERAASWAA